MQVHSGVPKTICHIDDVLVFAETHDEHLELLDKVFTAFEGTGDKRNNDQCQYFTNSVDNLGHVFSSEEARPTLLQIQAILEVLVPQPFKKFKLLLDCVPITVYLYKISLVHLRLRTYYSSET